MKDCCSAGAAPLGLQYNFAHCFVFSSKVLFTDEWILLVRLNRRQNSKSPLRGLSLAILGRCAWKARQDPLQCAALCRGTPRWVPS